MKAPLCLLLLLISLATEATAQGVVCSTVQQTCTTGGGGGGASASSDNSWTGTQTFIDTKFLIGDDGDSTKKLAFQLSGVTTGNTRTLTVPNASGTIPLLNQNQAWTGQQDFSTITLTSGTFMGLMGAGGSTAANNIGTATSQTPDAGMLFTGSTANSWIVAETNDASFDFAHPLQLNPTLFIHSANQSTTQWAGITHDGTYGIFKSGSSIAFDYNGSGTSFAMVLANGGALVLANDMYLGWASGTYASAVVPAAFFKYDSVASIQMGIDVNGAAVAQTFKAHDGITGSNVAGANLNLAGGRGTGSATGGNLALQTSPSLASGTTAQTLESRLLIAAKQLTLVSAAATTFAVETLGNDTGGGGTLSYCVYAADATTAGLECGSLDYAGIDVTAGAGGEVCPTPVKHGTPLQALSGSTLTVAFSATTGTDLCNLQVTATTSIATPVELWIKATYLNSGRTITPQ